jgi:hypothetical protein
MPPRSHEAPTVNGRRSKALIKALPECGARNPTSPTTTKPRSGPPRAFCPLCWGLPPLLPRKFTTRPGVRVRKSPAILQLLSQVHGWGIVSSAAAEVPAAVPNKGYSCHRCPGSYSRGLGWVASCNFPFSWNGLAVRLLPVAVEERWDTNMGSVKYPPCCSEALRWLLRRADVPCTDYRRRMRDGNQQGLETVDARRS